MSELKPCPFCGGEARLILIESVGNSLFTVLCLGCDVLMETNSPQRESAAEAWNHRAETNYQHISEHRTSFRERIAASIAEIKFEEKEQLYQAFCAGYYASSNNPSTFEEWYKENHDKVSQEEVPKSGE